jgi:hypothetical protein
MTAASLSLVEPDMEISPIRLSPGSSLPESIHNACCLAFCPSFCLSSRTLFCRRSFHFNQLRSLLTRHDPGQGSLAPARLNRDFPATIEPIRHRGSAPPTVMASRQGLSATDSQPGLPSSWRFFLRARSPLTPGSPVGANGRCFPIRCWLHLIRQAGHSHCV